MALIDKSTYFRIRRTERRATIEAIAVLIDNFHYWQGSSDLADARTKEWLAAKIRSMK